MNAARQANLAILILFSVIGLYESCFAKSFRILRFISQGEGKTLVLLDAGTEDGMRSGTNLESYRFAEVTAEGGLKKLKVVTGKLQVLEAQPSLSIANITQQASILSKKLFAELSGPIVGDHVKISKVKFSKKLALIPRVQLDFQELFLDPAQSPKTFELSSAGKKAIRKVSEDLAKRRIDLVIVEGHTNREGNRKTNQIESYQRAQAVRQYLVEVMQLDEKRVKAIGFGESQLLDLSNSDGHRRNNRRIVIKAIPLGKNE